MAHPVAYGRVLPPPDRDPRLAELLDRIEAEASASYRSFRTPAELGRMVRDDLAVLRTSDSSDTPPNTPREMSSMPYVEASDHASLFVTHGFGEELVTWARSA